MMRLDDVEAADFILHEDRAAADDDDGQGLGREPRALDGALQHIGDSRLDARDQAGIEMRDLLVVAEERAARRDDHVGRGERAPAEDERLPW